jgi:ppGpp synthetase/RelA/SpoT-type nucleotidyltranferase
MIPRPWSTRELKHLSDTLRREASPDSPLYDDVVLWFGDLASEVQRRIAETDWSPLLGTRIPRVTARAKTQDTLRQKLARQPHHHIGTLQDVAGVRFEADMTLDEQDAVAFAIAGMFEQPKAVHDLRTTPHSGYRALHVRLRLEGRVEVQVRTRLQGAWANMFERAADVIGRHVRYDVMPSDPYAASLVGALMTLSTERIAELEDLRNSTALALLGAQELMPATEEQVHALDRIRRRIDDLENVVAANIEEFRAIFDQAQLRGTLPWTSTATTEDQK